MTIGWMGYYDFVSPFPRYSVTLTVIQTPIVVAGGKLIVLPINRAMRDDAGQSSIPIVR